MDHVPLLEKLLLSITFGIKIVVVGSACSLWLEAGWLGPLTIVPSTLDNLAHAFTNQQTQVDSFVADGNVAHLTDANSNADTALLQLNQVPGVNTPEELIELVGLISRYRIELDGAAQNWSQAVSKAKGQVAELDTKLSVLRQEVETAATQVNAQLDGEKQKIANQAIEFQKSFTEAQEARTNTYTETLRKTQETLSNTLSEQQGQFSAPKSK